MEENKEAFGLFHFASVYWFSGSKLCLLA